MAIADHMNRLGHQTKQGQPWQAGNVRSVLTNRHTERLLQFKEADAECEAV
jgi:hypothetical protein